MTRIYQLDQINSGGAPTSIDSTYLTVLEDASGIETTRLQLSQLVNYLFSLASSDETTPFAGFPITIGYLSSSTSEASIAVGTDCTSNTAGAASFGTGNLASGESSLALGVSNTSSGYGSTCAGYGNTVSGDYSSCAGYGNNVIASVKAQAFGCDNTIGAYEVPGNFCSAFGLKNVVFGPVSPEGFGAGYDGKSTGCGYFNFVAGCYNTACGAYNNVTAEENFVFNCQAFGYQNICSGYVNCTALGVTNTSSAPNATSVGSHNTANDINSAAFGSACTASGYSSFAAGYSCTAAGGYSLALGSYCNATQNNSTCCGYNCTTSLYENTSAFGFKAFCRIQNTTNIAGPIIVRGDNDDGFNASEQFTQYGGVQNVLMSGDVDLTQTTLSISSADSNSNGTGYQVDDTIGVSGGNGDAVLTVAAVDDDGAPTSYTITTPGTGYSNNSAAATSIISSSGDGNATVNITVFAPTEIDLPFNATFYVDEVGIILDSHIDTLTVQPFVSFGWADGTPNSAGILASVQTTNLTQLTSREVYSTLLTYDGQKTLTASVTTGATANFQHGRFMWKGVLVENTPIGS